MGGAEFFFASPGGPSLRCSTNWRMTARPDTALKIVAAAGSGKLSGRSLYTGTGVQAEFTPTAIISLARALPADCHTTLRSHRRLHGRRVLHQPGSNGITRPISPAASITLGMEKNGWPSAHHFRATSKMGVLTSNFIQPILSWQTPRKFFGERPFTFSTSSCSFRLLPAKFKWFRNSTSVLGRQARKSHCRLHSPAPVSRCSNDPAGALYPSC